MALHQITDNIWLGSLIALRADNELAQGNVTHILSVLSECKHDRVPSWQTSPIFSKITDHLKIGLDDMPGVDIMRHFNESNAFIQDAVSKHEGVLVHCAAGKSRSVSCVCAYLMKTNKWDAQTAIEFVRKHRAVADPNPSFLEQLDLYYECGYEVSDDNKLYREWKSKNLDEEDKRAPIYTKILPPKPFSNWKQVIPVIVDSQHMKELVSTVPQQIRINDTVYAITERVVVPPTDPIHFVIGKADFSIDQTKLRALLNQTLSRSSGSSRCKSCSTKIASTNSIVTHEIGGQGKCQHYFIEPVEWMRPELERGEIEGKSTCPKCGHKVGSYQWQGSKCSCGTWVTPSIKLSKAKVDGMSSPPLL